jgi:hypothetical protein
LDFLKDLSEAWSQRLRSPIIGSIALSFFAINWQPIWYLLFADRPVRQKFLFFEANTTPYTLILCPILVGVALAMASPWLRMVGAWWAQFPYFRMKRLQYKTAHDLKVIQMTFEAERAEGEASLIEAEANLQAKRDRAKINAAKLLEEATDVGGDELKEDLEIDRWYNRRSDAARTLLTEASRGGGEITVRKFIGGNAISAGRHSFDSLSSPRELAKIEAGISELERHSLIRSQNPDRSLFKMTEMGYEVSDQIK